MKILKSKSMNFLFVIIVMGALSACTPRSTETTAPTTEQVAWQQSGNTYTYAAEYEVPGHMVEDTFSITLDDDNTVLAVEAMMPEEMGKHEESVQEFVEELQPMIVGKNLGAIEEYDTISGSSLTTAAFNEGINKLQAQLETNS